MNYWLLISAFWLLMLKDLPLTSQRTNQNHFVKVINHKDWHLGKGDNKSIRISFMIQNGFHIQADKVVDDNLIPTTLNLISPEELLVGEPIFPAPARFHFINESNIMSVFSGVLEVLIPIKTQQSIKTGRYRLVGVLDYQACDSVKCYFPRKLDFVIPVEIR